MLFFCPVIWFVHLGFCPQGFAFIFTTGVTIPFDRIRDRTSALKAPKYFCIEHWRANSFLQFEIIKMLLLALFASFEYVVKGQRPLEIFVLFTAQGSTLDVRI